MWATENNLKLNRDKIKEIAFRSSRKRMPLPPHPGIERVTSLRILGIIVNGRMTAANHVTMLLSSCSSLLYAMRVLRAHGIPATSLHDIFRATVISQIQYAAPAWSECVHLPLIMHVWTRFCVTANVSATAATTCRPSLICLTLLMMISSNASISTPVTCYCHICLTRSTYLTNFEPAHTT